MALAFRVICRNRYNFNNNLTKPVKWVGKDSPVKVFASGICYSNNNNCLLSVERNHLSIQPIIVKRFSTQSDINTKPNKDGKKQSLVQRLKEMYRNYWYVAVPVHLCTSAMWFGSFYYAVKSGVDVIALLQSIGVKETIIAPLRDSGAGYVALAFALYKVATPLRYAVTVGVTTLAIRKLTSLGLIKPLPSKQRIKEMYQQKKNNFLDSKEQYKIQIKEKKSNILDEMKRYKAEMHERKNKKLEKEGKE